MAKKKNKSVQTVVTAPSPAEAYEAAYFARKCGLTQEEALELLGALQRMDIPRSKIHAALTGNLSDKGGGVDELRRDSR